MVKATIQLIVRTDLAQPLPLRLAMNHGLSNLRAALLLLGVLFILPASASAQGGSISGSGRLPSGAALNERARVVLQTDRGIRSNVYTDNRGRFQFDRLTPDLYEVVIEADGDRFEIAKVSVEVFPGSPVMINVNLKEKKPRGSANAGKVISTGELDTAIPAPAKKEFDRASDASKSGKADDAIAHFRKAVALYPQYVMAHNDLGAELLEAIAELKTALDLQPYSPAARLYHGLALAGSNALDDAERELKTAHELGGPTYAVALF